MRFRDERAIAHAATFWAMPEIGFALCIHVDGLTIDVTCLLQRVIAVPTFRSTSIFYNATLSGLRRGRYLSPFPGVPVRDVRFVEHHGHDVGSSSFFWQNG